MTIRQLRTLVAIADEKTFSAAADVVHVTHAAVSQQMQTLEADLGVALFDRSTRPPELTPIAHQIVDKARKLIADYDNLLPSVLADGGFGGVIKLGTVGTALTGLMPRAMADFKMKFPKAGVHIRPSLTSAALADIERGNLDAAILTKPHLLPSSIRFRQLADEPMQLITSTSEVDDDPIRLLKTKPFIRFNRNAVVGTLIENWLSARCIRVNETMELDGQEAISSMVQANLGVSIVPNLAVKPAASLQIKGLSLGPDAPVRVLGFAYHKDHVKTQVIDEVFAALQRVIAEAGQRVRPE